MMLIFLLLTTCLARKINSHSQEYNIFTIQHYNQSLDQIKSYTYDDIKKYKLDINHHINMYSLFTKSYFERCHNYNDNNCDYTIEEQEVACIKYILDSPNPNEYPSNMKVRRQLYYYGVYNNQLYDFIIKPDGYIYELNRYGTSYHTKGLYIIEDLIDSELDISIDLSIELNQCNFKYYNYDDEPADFHRRMMLYLASYNNKTIFCPYWELKPYNL
jgi:hypothetical protein